MAPFCYSENIAMTPYSALASGRLSRHPGETSKRMEEDSYAWFKYDDTAEADGKIIRRVEEIAKRRGVSMTEVSLAWLLTKVTSPAVGATKFSHVDGAAKEAENQTGATVEAVTETVRQMIFRQILQLLCETMINIRRDFIGKEESGNLLSG